MTHDQPAGAAADRDLRLDDGAGGTPAHDDTDRSVAAGPLVFALTFLMLVAGLWGMGLGFDADNGVLFSGGLLLASVAFAVPLHLKDR